MNAGEWNAKSTKHKKKDCEVKRSSFVLESDKKRVKEDGCRSVVEKNALRMNERRKKISRSMLMN